MNLLTLKVNNLVITEFGYEIGDVFGDIISELSNFVSASNYEGVCLCLFCSFHQQLTPAFPVTLAL